MKTFNFPSSVLICVIMFLLSSCHHTDTENIALVPSPSSVVFGTGEFTFTHDTVISVEDERQKEIADWFAWLFARPAGFVPKVSLNAKDADIVLLTNRAMAHEEYRINAGRRNIVIEASGSAGFFYAFQTLRQAMPDSIGSNRHVDGQIWTVPVMILHDTPRFSHRCLKVDISEHFIPAEELMAFVEYMAMLKLNHLHLSGHGSYVEEDLAMLMKHASGLHVNVVCADGKDDSLYTCPDDIASKIYPSVAAMAEVAWSDRNVVDKIGFNRAVDAIDMYLEQTVLGMSDSIYDISLACLRR